MRRTSSPALLIALSLVAAACTGSGTEREPSTISPPTAAPVTSAVPELVRNPPTGRLVVVAPDGGVVTMAPDGADVTTVATGRDDTLNFQPQWAPGAETLAWGRAGPDGFEIVITDGEGQNRSSVGTADLPFYIYWAPDGEQLVALYNSATGGVEARHVNASDAGTTVIGNAAPYYFAWEPDSGSIAAHTGESALDIIETDGSSSSLAVGSPLYQAPNWSPRGIFHLTKDGIVLDDGAGASDLVATVPGPAWFSADPTGTFLAVQPFAHGQSVVTAAYRTVPQLLPNVLSVLDVAGGEVSVATSVPSAGVFWSPDGSTLAVLTEAETPGELRWVLWKGGETTTLASFAPAASFVRGVLPFAGQYALSLNLWSPASDALAFAGAVDGTDGIWVQRSDGSAPALVAQGTWVAWSRH